jgi:hypothetical protein
MTRSILGLLIIAGVFALVGDILANLMRVAEIRSIKRELRRFVRAFESDKSSIKVITKYIKSDREIPEPGVKIHVVDEAKKDDLPKFGDE